MKITIKLLICLTFISTAINLYAQEVTECPSTITCNGNICTRPDALSGSWKCAYRPSPRYPETNTLNWTSAHIRSLSHATCDYSDGTLIVQCVARVNHIAINPNNWDGAEDAVCTSGVSDCAMQMDHRFMGVTVDRNATSCPLCEQKANGY